MKNAFFPLALRLLLVILGFSIAACGLVLMLKSALGMGPWGALEVGLSGVTGLSVGHMTQIISLILIFVAWGLRFRPSVITVLNMFFIGWFMDLFMNVIPVSKAFYVNILLYAAGLVLYCFGISFYLSIFSKQAGPRESVMLGLSIKLKISIRLSRIIIDVFALLLAFLFKGPIGIGTIIFAVAAGPLIQQFLRLSKALD